MTLCFCHHLPSGCSLHWPRPLYLGPSHGCTWCHACGHPPNPGLGHRPHPQQGEHDSPAGCTAGPCELAQSSRRNCHHLPRVMSDISGEVRHYPSSLLQAALGSHPSNESPLRSNLLRIQSGSYTELGESWAGSLESLLSSVTVESPCPPLNLTLPTTSYASCTHAQSVHSPSQGI